MQHGPQNGQLSAAQRFEVRCLACRARLFDAAGRVAPGSVEQADIEIKCRRCGVLSCYQVL
jgi:DNA-directed RNA polymerase subunit RPC12/RpoP